MKSKILIISVILLIATAILFLSIDKIIVFALSKFYGINISYTALSRDMAGGYSFENLKILNKRLGAGFFSARANLKLNKKTSIFKSLDIDLKFKDVHFIRNKPEEAQDLYDSLDKLVAVPFEGRWTYRDVAGTVEIFSNGLTLRNFTAAGNEIKLLLSGDIYYNNVVAMDITIYFSKDILKNIPQELHSLIMRDEPQLWKSFSVKLKGNYQTPSIQVSGKLFRLNVGTVTVKD